MPQSTCTLRSPPRLRLKLSSLRCALCGLSAHTKWARPFSAERTGTGYIILCRLCDRRGGPPSAPAMVEAA